MTWVRVLHRPDLPRARLFGFPYSGTGPQFFRGWAGALPGIEIAGVELPGRQRRLFEPPVTELRRIVDAVAAEIECHLDLPYAFFGHSFGALLAYEVACRLCDANKALPSHLFVSAFRSPNVVRHARALHELPDREFIAELKNYGGTPDQVLQDPEAMRLFLPALRADFLLHETYRWQQRCALPMPITAFYGTRDLIVPAVSMEEWASMTAARFKLIAINGGHFFIHSATAEIAEELRCAFVRDVKHRHVGSVFMTEMASPPSVGIAITASNQMAKK
jgi:medium-chain acyl-[acyl-carrier-protein] hydrolase